MRTAPLLLLSLFLANAAIAQTLEQSANLRLDDNTPRTARSIALGGATDALGDVDMAANPATLINVTRPMLFAAGSYDSTGTTRNFVRDNFPAAESIRVDGRGLTYAAAAKPVGGAVIGVYYAAVPRQAGPDPLIHTFGTEPYQSHLCPYPCSYLTPVSPEAFERTEQRYGLALPWKFGPFDFGAGAEMQRIREVGENVRVAISDVTATAPVIAGAERFIAAAESREVVPNVGVRWRATPRLALAASYTGAGTLRTRALVCNAPDLDSPVCSSSTAELGNGSVPIPDTLRAGVSFAATERLRLVAEGVRRGWGRQEIRYQNGGKVYADTNEFHAGAEYRLGAVALRGGWWRDPAHVHDPFPEFAMSQTITHRTIGAGVDVGHGARLDLALDDASLRNQRRAVIGMSFGL